MVFLWFSYGFSHEIPIHLPSVDIIDQVIVDRSLHNRQIYPPINVLNQVEEMGEDQPG